jgi:hypothetical protein
MDPRPYTQSTSNEAKLILAIQAISNDASLSERKAAELYGVDRMLLNRRRTGMAARRDCQANSKKLTKLEEEVIVEHIIELDSRGFSPSLAAVRDMANTLLRERSAPQIGQNWPSNFVARTPSIKTRLNRPYDYRRARCEDPEIISRWFELVQSVVRDYGIAKEDIFNFDETGFQMGVISSQMVVTGTERRNRPKAVQPGDREWVTVIQGVCAAGWSIPPYIILKAKHHQSVWYSEEIPKDWMLAVSDNGWTTNEHGIEWIKHFNSYTKARCVGSWRLLILDGHESHHSPEFLRLCKENRIIALCMPAHASHILQPLDVGCFSPLKRAYGTQISQSICYGINHITKESFLPAFKAAYDKSITMSNIHAGFRATGLVPFEPDTVLSQLDVKLRTPTPEQEAPTTTIWTAKTPSNSYEFNAQKQLLCTRIQNHQNSSPSAILELVEQLNKGHTKMAHLNAIQRSRTAALEQAVKEITQRKQRKKKRIQAGGALLVAQGIEMASSTVGGGKKPHEEPSADGKASRVRRCARCKTAGHNSRTCKSDVEGT